MCQGPAYVDHIVAGFTNAGKVHKDGGSPPIIVLPLFVALQGHTDGIAD
jgi:hypothetical protein